MNINPLTPDLIHLLSPSSGNRTTGRQSNNPSVDFGSILTNAFREAADLDAADKASALAFLKGETDDFSGLLIDIQKAELSLNLALQIRNKIVDSYNEVIRMSM